MTRRDLIVYIGLLVMAGAAWGLTMPLTKIAVSTGHKHFGLIFWQMAIGTLVLTLLYRRFAILGPSATLAEVADGVVRDV